MRCGASSIRGEPRGPARILAPGGSIAGRAGPDTGARFEIVAFAAVGNRRSRAVMERIGMTRDAEGDFDMPTLPEDSPVRRHVLYRISAADRI